MFRISFFRLFTLLRRPEDRFELDFDPLPAEFDPADPDPRGCSRLLLELLLEFFIFLRDFSSDLFFESFLVFLVARVVRCKVEP